jgi:hypothetical protein
MTGNIFAFYLLVGLTASSPFSKGKSSFAHEEGRPSVTPGAFSFL